MDDREVTGAFLTVEFLTVENLHHRLEPGVELCKPVAKVECLVSRRNRVGRLVACIRCRLRDDGVNAVIAAALEDESIFFCPHDRLPECRLVGH